MEITTVIICISDVVCLSSGPILVPSQIMFAALPMHDTDYQIDQPGRYRCERCDDRSVLLENIVYTDSKLSHDLVKVRDVLINREARRGVVGQIT